MSAPGSPVFVMLSGILAVLLVLAVPAAALSITPVTDAHTTQTLCQQGDPFKQYSGSKDCQKDCYYMCAVSCNDGWCMSVCMNTCDDYCSH